MALDRPAQAPGLPARIWRIGEAEYDESRQELRVNGVPRPIEAKPLALLLELLLRGGEVASKAELMQAVWPGVQVVEASLPTAISKLRNALGDGGRTIVESVPRIGYRIGVPIATAAAAPKARLGFALRAGQIVPGRPHWRLERPLGAGGAVWQVTVAGTGESRVLRFADSAETLDRLKSDWAVSEALASLGERPDLVRLCGHDFETRPFLTESFYHGVGLPDWLKAGLAAGTCPVEERIELVRRAAQALAAAHGIGVLHGALSPTDILVQENGAGPPSLRVAGFRVGRATPSPFYTAPELLLGRPQTIASDVHALGIILFQTILGDFRRPLATGWESEIDDPVLRSDIADATAGDPSRRLASASLLADRLHRLSERREERARQERERDATARLARQIERARLRRPWLVLAGCCLLLGLLGSGAAGLRAMRERDAARRQTRITQSVNTFLTEDLLGRGNPLRSGRADETLMEAATHAEPAIALRLRTQPLIAASLYRAMALAFDGRSAYAPARDAYRRAIAAFEAAEGPESPDAVILRLRWAQMEALSAQDRSLDRARTLLAAALPLLPRLGPRRAEAEVWALMAEAALAMVQNELDAALREVREAADRADRMPELFDEGTRLQFRTREVAADTRLGDWRAADRLIRVLEQRTGALVGPDHPDTLLIGLARARELSLSGDDAGTVAVTTPLCPRMQLVFGTTDHQTVLCSLIRAASEILLGRYADGVRDNDDAYRTVAASQGPHAQLAVIAKANSGSAQCRAGATTDGIARLRDAQEGAEATFGPQSPLAQTVLKELGVCLVLTKRFDEAFALLDRIDPHVADRSGMTADTVATIDLARADQALSRGDRNAAGRLLREPQQVFSRRGADPFFRNWTARLRDEAVQEENQENLTNKGNQLVARLRNP